MRTHNNVQDFLGRIQIGSVDQLMQFCVRHFIEQKIIYAKQMKQMSKYSTATITTTHPPTYDSFQSNALDLLSP